MTNAMLALARMAEFVGEFWLDLIAVAQRGAGIGDDGVAFAHALADLDVLVGMKADAHAPRLDGAVAHYLHAGALGLVEDGGIRHRDAAAAAGIDGGAGEAAQAQRRIALDRDAHAAELRHRVDFRRYQADRAGQLAPVFDLDARGLSGRQLWHVDAGDLRFELDLAVDGNAEQRIGARVGGGAEHSGGARDGAGGRRLERHAAGRSRLG